MWITIMTTITKLRQRCEMRGPQAPLSGMGTLRLTCFESNWNGIIIALTRVFYLQCLESGIRVVLIKFELGRISQNLMRDLAQDTASVLLLCFLGMFMLVFCDHFQ